MGCVVFVVCGCVCVCVGVCVSVCVCVWYVCSWSPLYPNCTVNNLLLFQLPGIEQTVKDAGHTILTPLVSLDTPGKATVQVVILADPVCTLNHGECIRYITPL